MSKQRIALILSLFAFGVAGCGDDDDEDAATTIPTVPLSVPGDDTSTLGDDDTDTTVDTVPDTATPAPTPTPTPAPTPTPPAETPDSPENDTPPPEGSEAEQFEDFCTENPGAC
jgi:hypothetical protein